MTAKEVRSALELTNAINSIVAKTKPINKGDIPNFNEFRKLLSEDVLYRGVFEDKDFELETLGEKYSLLTIDDAQVQDLYTKAEVSGYGDVREMKTKIDASVRSGRHISDFKVDGLAETVADAWNKSPLKGNSVRAVPYRINLYGKGDHFAMHKDTPEKNLIGTVLVSTPQLYCSTGDHFPCFRLFNKGTNNPTYWYEPDDVIGYCAFYTDLPHSVERLTHGWRLTIAFKIYCDSLESSENKAAIELASSFARPFGILLSHEYSIEDTVQKGLDADVVATLKKLKGAVCTVVPCILKNERSWDTSSDPREEGPSNDGENDKNQYDKWLVYPITEELITLAKHDRLDETPETAPIPFERLTGGDLFSESTDESADYTGNESRPGCQTSLYLHSAVIVTDQDKANQGTKRKKSGKYNNTKNKRK